MTRIIGGSAGGRRLSTPPGTATRPTADRVREALFSSIEAATGSLDGLGFLDLYAGSGAVGLEALSRGAGVATLVESDRRTAGLIATNARTLGFPRAEVLAAPVAATLGRAPVAPYDVVFMDPPYPLSEEDLAADLAALVSQGWLVPDALVVVERSRRSPEPAFPAGFVEVRSRKYGETTLWSAHAPVDEPGETAAEPVAPAPGAGEQ
ncbi:16S rRNA (guanine(966)-N(2))-methyltransferase RsmD [Nocardioides sp. 31GB23]|uniref:16S rRNA (guanine(966)-N(2))-methyltransferase RsmD n=1 Tax=Nocardioides sp. 31GB23 TaxID=3156065 RepID=UPI0032AFCE28